MTTAFDELCRQGAVADAMLAAGDDEKAIHAYGALIELMLSEKELKRFVLAKSVLGILLALVKLEDLEKAYRLWSGGEGVGAARADILQLGIKAMVDGKLSAHDSLIHRMLTGLMQTQVGGDSRQAAESVNSSMRSACEAALETEPALVDSIIRNWKHHLQEIFIGPVPTDVRSVVEGFEKRLGGSVRLGNVSFPAPSRWVIDRSADVDQGGLITAAELARLSPGSSAGLHCPNCGATLPNEKLLAIHARRCGPPA